MERRAWGITHDSDRVNTFLSNTDRRRGVMFPGVDFSGNPNRSSPSDDDRIVVDEVDFFSDKNKEKGVINVKKENSHEEGPKNKLDTALHLLTTNTGSDQSTVDDGISLSSDERDNRARNELVVLKAELERMNAENQRLTAMLSQATNNYNALQMHLMSIMQQQQQQHNLRGINTHEQEREVLKLENKKQEGVNDQIRPRQFMELGLITTETDNDQQSQSSSEERTHSGSQITNQNNTTELVTADHYQRKKNKGIQREEMPESHETWVSNKVMKVSEPKSVDQATEATMRKVRVSVRARSEAPMITDGCQWRKYGQKMAKGNPCPRAYYRCTMALGCPVRKQVQRCADDKTILITTYEGTHNHPLPPAAMAMASTTSAAANMLLSGSMPSADGLMNPNFLARAILPCSSSVATISASAPFPTVTLDLTHSSNPLQLQRPQTQFNMPIANMGSQDGPVLFGQPLHNLSKFSGLQMSQEMSSAQLGQLVQNHAFNADTLSAATAAIAADPNFTAALAAAIGSIIGRGQQNSNDNNNTTSNATTTTSNGNKNNIGGFRGN